MSSLGSPNPFFIAGKKAYEVKRSLRFDRASGDMTLNRTPSGSGNQKTWTFSAWIKRASLSANYHMIFEGKQNGSNYTAIYFDNTDKLRIEGYAGSQIHHLKTSQVFRDVASWQHLVVAFDTTQGTASNRINLYVNGIQITDFETASYPSQDYDTFVNSTQRHDIGRGQAGNSQAYGGYMAEINLTDGQQYDASYFGKTDVLTGQWNPKKYGGGYGTNGFYLNFSDNSGTTATTLGKDSSGNDNNFTPNNFSVAAGVGNDSLEDTPTNNFPTFNPVDPGQGSSVTLSNGNMDITTATGSSTTYANFVIPKTGKWFMEATMTNNGPNYAPIIQATNYIGMTTYTYTNSNLRYYINGEKRLDGTWSSYGATFTQNDVIGVAVDVDNNQVTFYKNGASQGAISFTFASGVDYFFAASDGSSFGSGAYSWNFGQRPFVYTQPTGFKTICSANLPEPTILLPNEHFNTVIYSGDGNSTKSITGVGFKADWLWLKGRNTSYSHLLYDAVRGAGSLKAVNSNETRPEGSTVQDDSTFGFLNSFDSDGFSVTKGSDSTSYTNGGSSTYVAWNWNAGDTDGKTYTVTVVSDSGNKYRFDGFGTSAVTLDLAEGGTYIFNYPSGHPFRFSTTADGTHGGGSEYTTGVTHNSSTQVTIVVAASAPTLYYYCSSHSGMGGQVNTNSTLGSSNFDGTIQSTAKVNATAGFSIIAYEGTGSTTTVGHGLGVKPDVMIFKNRDQAHGWLVYHKEIGATKNLSLNTTAAEATASNKFNNTEPTSTVFTVSTAADSNQSGQSIISYCFSEVQGYSKFGSYTGNGNSNGTFVFTGFRPAWVLIKRINLTRNWIIYDNKRGPFNEVDNFLEADTSNAEDPKDMIDFLSNGFKLRDSDSDVNANDTTPDEYIYLCFAESPFKYSRAR